MAPAPFIALTDRDWFDYLSTRSLDRRVDEVNFWSPKSNRRMKAQRPGEPIFFRLKSPTNAIVGYGFFAHFALLGLREAWETFGDKNGDPDIVRFLTRIGRYRKQNLFDPREVSAPLGCTILRDAVFWPRERWIKWDQELGWPANSMRGKTEHDGARASRLLEEIGYDQMHEPEDFADVFVPSDVDEREVLLAKFRPRVGQGTFRARLLDAYGRRCAVTGEKTEPVLDAAHVQSYLGPKSNHVQNGILMTQEFHTLFDKGLVSITPEYEVRVSPAIQEKWSNGKRYYQYDKQPILLPKDPKLRPCRAALEWHAKIFVA